MREILLTPECVGCGQLGQSLCTTCSLELHHFDIPYDNDLLISCVSTYGGWLRERIIEYKNGKGYLAPSLAALLSPHIPYDSVLVPIPTTKSKVRMRGFNTVGMLCKELVRDKPSREILPALAFNRAIRDQVGLGEQERKANISHAMSALQQVTGEIVLVDDVVTTGATINEARRALTIAGAAKVSAFALCGSPIRRYG